MQPNLSLPRPFRRSQQHAVEHPNSSPDAAVIATNSDAAVSKASCVRAGYYDDDFLKFFVGGDPSSPLSSSTSSSSLLPKRPPLINRGASVFFCLSPRAPRHPISIVELFELEFELTKKMETCLKKFRLLLPARGHFGSRRRVPLPSREKLHFRSSRALPDSQPRGRLRHALLQAARRREGTLSLCRARPPRSRLSEGRRRRGDAGARGKRRAATAGSFLFFFFSSEEARSDRHREVRAAPLRPPRPFPDLDRDPPGAARGKGRGRRRERTRPAGLDRRLRELCSLLFRPRGPDALRLRVRARLPPSRGRGRGPQGRVRDAE